MSLNLVPDYCFDKFSHVTPDFLINLGICGVVLDVDNTLEPYENPLPGQHVIAWIDALRGYGINCAIASNNGGERIELFNSVLGLPVISKAKKPFAGGVKKAMAALGTDRTNTIFIGDQILTDVWAAHNAGIKAILVPPIKDRTDLFTRFKRVLEKPFLRIYKKRNRE